VNRPAGPIAATAITARPRARIPSEVGGYVLVMTSEKQRAAARKNVRKAQSASAGKRTIANLSSATRSALGREGAKAAARKRGATRGTGTGAGAMTVTELRREAARLDIDGRSKMGKSQLIRAVGQKRRSSS
jgi:hypothetical protein